MLLDQATYRHVLSWGRGRNRSSMRGGNSVT
jgi:hypothetical protein